MLVLRAGNSALTENKAHSSYLSAAGSAHVTRVGNMAQTGKRMRLPKLTIAIENRNWTSSGESRRKKKKVVQEVGSVLIFFHLTTHQGCV